MVSTESVNIMKRKSQWGLTGICNCGCYHDFKINDFKESDNKKYLLLKQPFVCEYCNSTFDKVENREKKVDKVLAWGLLSIVSILLLFGGYKIISPFFDFTSHNSPTSIDDMTNKQYQEFQKWQDKQDKQKWENQKVNE